MVDARMELCDQDNMRVTAAQFAAKFRSKREIFNFLTVEARAYLCGIECLTIYFLKDLSTGKRKFIRCEDVRYAFCPQYDGLSIEDILDEWMHHPQVKEFLPEERDIPKLPKQWITNLLASTIGDNFVNWIKTKVELRNLKVSEKRKLFLELDPEIARAFHQSTAVSTQKGNSAYLLKPGSKRRRTVKERTEQIEQEVQAHMELEQASEKVNRLEEELKSAKEHAQNNQAAAEILNDLLNKGDVELQGDGSVCVSKAKSSAQNSAAYNESR